MGSEARFRDCVDSDNNVDVSVFQGEVRQKSCGQLKLTYGLERSDQVYTLVCDSAGDTVKLEKTKGVIAVYEVVVVSSGTPLVLKIKVYITVVVILIEGVVYEML